MDDPEVAVAFRGVQKAFGPKRLYDQIDLTVRKREVLTILGGSGSGKSVLLRMVLGLLRPDAGDVQVLGQSLAGLGEVELTEVRRHVGMLFQGGALFDSMTVFDNVSYALVERGERDRGVLERRVAEVLEMVGLPGIEKQMPAELSGGMKKRVALARAVADVPKVLLYDEPTTGLDPMNVRRISELILRLRDDLGVTSIVVTHDLASAFLVSDRLAMLADRRIVEVCERARFRQSENPNVQEFLSAMPLADREEARA